MHAERMQDAIHRGLGRAARSVGHWCAAYRPTSAAEALAPRHLVLRLQAGFAPAGGSYTRTPTHGQVFWHGLFDAAYTRPGDYLVRRETRQGAADGGVWFIVAQPKLLPVLCVRATRVASFTRPPASARPGVGSYGGTRDLQAERLLTDWPVAVIQAGGDGTGDAGLPDDARGASWTVLLPSFGGVVLQGGDVVTDDLGRKGVVASAELSEHGWRLRVRQAGV